MDFLSTDKSAHSDVGNRDVLIEHIKVPCCEDSGLRDNVSLCGSVVFAVRGMLLPRLLLITALMIDQVA